MMWRTHTLGGITALWLLTPVPSLLTPENIGPLAAVAAFGALLPDLDAGESKIRFLQIGGMRPFVPLSALIYQTWGHRGLLHAPLGLMLAGHLAILGGFVLTPLPFLALWVGYASHLALDACTRSGIPSWPYRPERRCFLLPSSLRFVTGSLAEEGLLPFLVLMVIGLLLRYFPQA